MASRNRRRPGAGMPIHVPLPLCCASHTREVEIRLAAGRQHSCKPGWVMDTGAWRHVWRGRDAMRGQDVSLHVIIMFFEIPKQARCTHLTRMGRRRSRAVDRCSKSNFGLSVTEAGMTGMQNTMVRTWSNLQWPHTAQSSHSRARATALSSARVAAWVCHPVQHVASVVPQAQAPLRYVPHLTRTTNKRTLSFAVPSKETRVWSSVIAGRNRSDAGGGQMPPAAPRGHICEQIMRVYGTLYTVH